MEKENFRKNNKKSHIPDSAYLRIKRPPILMLHIIAIDRINPKTQIDAGCDVPDYLFALGIGIPAIGDEKIANYVVNMVELKNYCDAEDDEDE